MKKVKRRNVWCLSLIMTVLLTMPCWAGKAPDPYPVIIEFGDDDYDRIQSDSDESVVPYEDGVNQVRTYINPSNGAL